MEQNQGGQCQGLADLHYKKRLSYRIKAKPDHATMCGLLMLSYVFSSVVICIPIVSIILIVCVM